MSRRRKKKYDSATQARRMARAALGTPPAGRVIPSKKDRSGKHKRRALEQEQDY